MYVTDALYAIDTHRELREQWTALIKQDKVADTRSGDEIAAEIIARAGLKVDQGGVK